MFFPKCAQRHKGSLHCYEKGLGGERLDRARKVPGASRLRVSYFNGKSVQQYRTSAFGPSKTRRTTDMFLEICESTS